MKTINIICVNNGVGLTQDRQIIADLLQQNGFKVFVNEGQPNSTRTRYDMNIFCEQLFHAWIPLAKKNVMIPNAEWFFEGWIKYLYRFDKVFCKTKDCMKIFSQYVEPERMVFTSFTSKDRFIPRTKKQRTFVHLAGKSMHKGTNAIVIASNSRKLPPIHIYTSSNNGMIRAHVDSHKIVLHTQRVPDEFFYRLQNEALFHLCPSEYEGWGHYINEAKSTGAIIITTNAAPMNELVTQKFGAGASTLTHTGTHHIAPLYRVNPESLADCIEWANGINDATAKRLSRAARQSYLKNDKEFKKVFIAEVKKLFNE